MRLLLCDLDGTIREPESGKKFINTPIDQTLIGGVHFTLKRLWANGVHLIGVTNQGGVLAGHKSLRDCIREQQHTLKLAPEIERIYFAISDNTVGCVSRSFINLRLINCVPKWLNIPQRYFIHSGMGENPKYDLGGFRKPNPGMLRLAMADFMRKHQITEGLIPTEDIVCDDNWFQKYRLGHLEFRMVGDRPEDREAAQAAGIDFIEAEQLRGDFHWNS